MPENVSLADAPSPWARRHAFKSLPIRRLRAGEITLAAFTRFTNEGGNQV
jgi:hypothetical protein